MQFSLLEQALLALLVAVSVAWFVKDLWPKIRHIRAGKPEDRPRTDRLPARLFTVLKEVVFQWRVVGGRKVAGTLHALVFLGFSAFALETVDHFTEPYGFSILHALLGDGGTRAFQLVLAVVAVLVIVGIVGLAYRRFVMVSISPGPKSYSSGVVALMIFLLMATYLNGILAEPLAPKANWWLHALLILAFPPLILRSKHFHILMAPFDIFLRTHTLGDYKPLDLDMEKLAEAEEEISLGLETVADAPWKMRMDWLTCVECRRCTDQCPAATVGQELKPRQFILAGRDALDGPQDAPVVGTVISEKALGQCTSCGACEAICPVGIEHLQLLIGAKRSQALASGVGMVATEFLQSVERHGNPFGSPGDRRAQLLADLGIPEYVPGETEYLLWLGCVWTYNQDAESSLRSMVEVLDRAGITYGVLPEESCSGHHSRRQGEELQFQTLANENMDRFEERSVAKVVTGCPHCFHTIRREYPTVREDFEVETIHHSELLMQLVQDGRITMSNQGSEKRITFHDPCYLGRYEKVTDEPRAVIAGAGFALTELPRRRERTYCCGGGSAGFARHAEDESNRVDQERKREIKESGADLLVTACPECKMMLDAAVDETIDLVELVARASRGDEAAGPVA